MLNTLRERFLLTFCMTILTCSRSDAQNNPSYFYHIFSSNLAGEVLVINQAYALVHATGRELEVYSLKTGFKVKSFKIPTENEPYSDGVYYSPWRSFDAKVMNYYSLYHRSIMDPELVPEPAWDVLLQPEYKTKQSDDEKGYDVFLADGTRLFFPVAKEWQRGAAHYCKARNSLILVNAQGKNPYMVDLKIFGLVEVNSKGEIINHIPSPVGSVSSIQVYGSHVLLQDRLYNLASKSDQSLSEFIGNGTARIVNNQILVCFNPQDDAHNKITLFDLMKNEVIYKLEDARSEFDISADLQTIIRYTLNGEGFGLRGVVSSLEGNAIVELICLDSEVKLKEFEQNRKEYERKTAFNKKLYADFMADQTNRLSLFNSTLEKFMSEAKSMGWTLVSECANPAKEFSSSDFNHKSFGPADSLQFDVKYCYWLVCVSALPMMECELDFFPGISNFPFIEIGSLGYGAEYSRDYLITHTGLIHPISSMNFAYNVITGYPAHYAETKSLPAGMAHCFVFKKKSNESSFELPVLSGKTLPEYYLKDFDERYEDCLVAYHAYLREEAERQRLETLKRLPTFRAPEPGSALYNLQMQIDAAVPATWATCSACGGSGVTSSSCSCCSGHGSIAVKRQVFHKMSEKTDEVYRADGPKGAGYYTRTSPVGYYKTESSYDSCGCCDGAGLITGRGVCGQCNGAGRVK